MTLVGQYDLPFVRRVAVSLRVLGSDYQHEARSVFADLDAMRRVNPVGRIPSLVLNDGEILIDSAATARISGDVSRRILCASKRVAGRRRPIALHELGSAVL